MEDLGLARLKGKVLVKFRMSHAEIVKVQNYRSHLKYKHPEENPGKFNKSLKSMFETKTPALTLADVMPPHNGIALRFVISFRAML